MLYIDWGDMPAWVAAVGTVGTLVAALLQIRSERLARKKLEEQKQATGISTWIGGEASPQSTGVVIQNMSNAPIYDVVITLVIAAGAGPQTGEEVAKLSDQQGPSVPSMRRATSIVPPGKYMTELPSSWGGMNRKPGIEIAFTDFQGNHWVRRYNGQLGRLEKDALQTMHYPLPFGDFSLSSLGS